MISSAETVRFGLEELAGIAPGVKGKGQYNGKCMIENLLESCDKDDNSYKNIEYNEQDIADLVEYMGMQDYSLDESIKHGEYTGKLIANLTIKNETLGKRTVIEIPENRLYYLGYDCKKFDVVKIGVNYGFRCFCKAGTGNLLYVKDCKGDGFAWSAGSHGFIDIIAAEEVNGTEFAGQAGEKCHVGIIAAKKVNANYFAQYAGSEEGHVGMIVVKEIEHGGQWFAFDAHPVDGIHVGTDIRLRKEKTTGDYNEMVKHVRTKLSEYGIDFGLNLKKIKLIKK